MTTTFRGPSPTALPILLLVALLLLAGCIAGPFGEDPAPSSEELGQEDGQDSLSEAETLIQGTPEGDLETTLQSLAPHLGNDTLLEDSDGDGLPDVVENFVYGSDPHNASTTDSGIPDGWLTEHGLDPTDPRAPGQTAALPNPDDLPPAYDAHWPEAYRWTVKDAYTHAIPEDWNLTEDGIWDNGIDPNKVSYQEGGIPYAWLVHHNISTTDATVEDEVLTEDEFTILDNYEHDTDPRLVDTAQNGLPDAEEVRIGTDPTAFSTSGSGIPDGWLVDDGFDPTDPRIGNQGPTGKGLSLKETWTYNEERFGLEDALEGRGLDPTTVSTLSLGIPDGWLVKHGLDPLDESTPHRVIDTASDHDQARNLTEAPADLEPLPDLELTVLHHYEHQKPGFWEEANHGVWEQGLDPSDPDEDDDGLPTVLELRGWYIQRSFDIGPEPEMEWVHVTSDPQATDTDGDGLDDGEEYAGEALRDEGLYRFKPTNPRSADTSFSGLSDAQEVFNLARETNPSEGETSVLEPLLDPTLPDTAGSYLTDGDEYAFWQAHADAVGEPYNELYPGSLHTSHLDWVNELEAFEDESLTEDDVRQAIGPAGDLDDDGLANLIDPDANGDGVLNGWAVEPETLENSDFPEGPTRQPFDPANPDTSGEGLPDAWKLEHGRPLETGGWDLTPATWDSNGDGESDADANLNDDVVEWFAFDDDGSRTRNDFNYNNLLEYEMGTNPRIADPQNDGITQGWEFFWTVRYPTFACGPDAQANDRIGEHRPTCEQVLSLQSYVSGDESTDPLGESVKRVGDNVQDIEFRRIAELPEGISPRDLLEPEWEEELADDNPDDFEFEVLTGDGSASTIDKRLAIIEGTYAHTFAMDQAFGLNPYLDDTSGDSFPDAWLTFYGELNEPCPGIDPGQHHSPGQDPTRSGLTLIQTYQEGLLGPGELTADPCLTDTDRGGLSDGDDSAPLSPATDAAASTGLPSTSWNGLSDHEEIAQGTNPLMADTPLDGLLDGETFTLKSSPHQTQWLLRWGIVHHEDDGDFTFFGAKSIDMSPLIRDSQIEGVPDGWLFYYGRQQAPPSESDMLLQAYSCNQPDWWNEDEHGVWWWGVGPDSTCSDDVDNDGLLDELGEDPVPAADRFNEPHDRRPAHVPDPDHREIPDVPDMHPQDALQDPSLSTTDRIQISQTWGACAGNPLPCRTTWNDNPPYPRAETTITAEWPPVVQKGEPFTVTGEVNIPACSEPSPCPAPHRTVTINLNGTDASPIGIGFTDEFGNFEIPACLCKEHEEAIPEEGMVALSRDEGTVSWSFETAQVQAGTLDLNASVYASQPFANEDGDGNIEHVQDASHPHWIDVTVDGDQYHATHRDQSPKQAVNVESETSLTINNVAPDPVGWAREDRDLTLEVTLSDATEDPVKKQPVTIETHGAFSLEETLTTDHQGKASTILEVPPVDGEITLTASYDSSSEEPYEASSASTSVKLQGPNEVTIILEEATVNIGDTLTFTTQVTSQGVPVPDRTVQVTLGDRNLQAQTGPDGTVTLNFDTTGLTPGQVDLRAHVDDTPAWDADHESTRVSLVTGASIDLAPPQRVDLGQPLTLSGRLTTQTGDPIPGETISFALRGLHLGNTTTRFDGTYEETLQIPGTLTPGLQPLSASFNGTSGEFNAATTSNEVRVVVPASLTINSPLATPGDIVTLRGSLQAGEDRILPGEHINITLENQTIDQVLTDKDGTYETQYLIPANETFGLRHGNATYAGSTNGTYSETQTRFTITVAMETTLQTEPVHELYRGENDWNGTLTSDSNPVPNAPIDLALPEGETRTVHTDEEGGFEVTFEVSTDPLPGALKLEATFPGNETLEPSKVEETGMLTIQPSLRTHIPNEAGRGTTIDIDAVIVDDVERPVPNATLSVTGFDESHQATTDGEGATHLQLNVPEDVDLGITTIHINLPSQDGLHPTQTSHTVTIKEGVHLDIESERSDGEPGGDVTLTARLTDLHENPITGEPILVRMEGVPTTIHEQTGADGTAQITLPAPEQNRDITIRYPGSPTYAAAENSTAALETHAATQVPVQDDSNLLSILAGTAMIGLFALGAVLYHRRRHRREDIRPLLEEAEERIDEGEPWKQVIQDTYRTLSEYLAEYGFHEKPAESPREFIQTLTQTVRIPHDAAVSLVHLYEEASYAIDEPEPDHADRARQELLRIVGQIENEIQGLQEES